MLHHLRTAGRQCLRHPLRIGVPDGSVLSKGKRGNTVERLHRGGIRLFSYGLCVFNAGEQPSFGDNAEAIKVLRLLNTHTHANGALPTEDDQTAFFARNWFS